MYACALGKPLSVSPTQFLKRWVLGSVLFIVAGLTMTKTSQIPASSHLLKLCRTFGNHSELKRCMKLRLLRGTFDSSKSTSLAQFCLFDSALSLSR